MENKFVPTWIKLLNANQFMKPGRKQDLLYRLRRAVYYKFKKSRPGTIIKAYQEARQQMLQLPHQDRLSFIKSFYFN